MLPQPPPGDPHDAKARGDSSASRSRSLRRSRPVVRGTAVELDDEPLPGPEHVDLEARDPPVDLWARQAVPSTKARNASSKTERVGASAPARRAVETSPGDPRRARVPPRARRANEPKSCASLTARARPRSSSTSARSTSVRNGVVTGMPRRVVAPPGHRARAMDAMPPRRRFAPPSPRRRRAALDELPQEAAERWLSTAAGPQARTAAIARASRRPGRSRRHTRHGAGGAGDPRPGDADRRSPSPSRATARGS